MISEKVELLGKGLYKDIPDVLTVKALPTVSELEYVGSEDFDETMLTKIFPVCIEEDINFHQLLEVDYQWLCRCIRLISFGPYYTTNMLFCPECGQVKGEARVNLKSIKCKPFPEGFVNNLTIKKDEFVDFNGDVVLHMPTIAEMLKADKDNIFSRPDGSSNTELARMCYMISKIGTEKDITPLTAKMFIENNLSAADYIILKDKVTELTDYGLRAGGSTKCPRCGAEGAAFIALVDDRFLRPTVGDIKQGRDDRSIGSVENLS